MLKNVYDINFYYGDHGVHGDFYLLFFLRGLSVLRGYDQLRMTIGHGPLEGRALEPQWFMNKPD